VANARWHSSLWRWRLVWGLLLALGVAALFPVVRWSAAHFRIAQARSELAQIYGRLEQFRAREGAWPAIFTPSQLLLVLRGRLDAQARPAERPWLLEGTQLFFRNANPSDPQGAILDPWGRPYGYFYHAAVGSLPASFVLFSAGPDGRHSPPVQWARGASGSAPEDADNIVVFPPDVPR
jgi:hypothetical protein